MGDGRVRRLQSPSQGAGPEAAQAGQGVLGLGMRTSPSVLIEENVMFLNPLSQLLLNLPCISLSAKSLPPLFLLEIRFITSTTS